MNGDIGQTVIVFSLAAVAAGYAFVRTRARALSGLQTAFPSRVALDEGGPNARATLEGRVSNDAPCAAAPITSEPSVLWEVALRDPGPEAAGIVARHRAATKFVLETKQGRIRVEIEEPWAFRASGPKTWRPGAAQREGRLTELGKEIVDNGTVYQSRVGPGEAVTIGGFFAVSMPDPNRTDGDGIAQVVVTGDEREPVAVTPGLRDEAMARESSLAVKRAAYIACVWMFFGGLLAWGLSAANL